MTSRGELWRQGGEGLGPLMSFPHPLCLKSPLILTLLSLLTQPLPDALDFVDQCVTSSGWSDRVHKMVLGERRGILCSLPLPLRTGEVEDGGSCLWRWMRGYAMPQAAQSLLPSVTLSTGTHCYSFLVFLSPHIYRCLSPSFFLFLLLSA